MADHLALPIGFGNYLYLLLPICLQQFFQLWELCFQLP